MKLINTYRRVMLCLSGVLGVMISLNAQQDAMYTHYMQNTLAVNPAYAGTRNSVSFALLHRSQWTGFLDQEGKSAASSQTFTMHTPLERKELGVGVSITNDRILPVRNTGIQGDLSYKIILNNMANLSFGLKTSLNFRRVELTSLALEDESVADPAFQYDRRSRVLPNFGTGVFYYTEEYYVGFSIPGILQNDFFPSSTTGNLRHVGQQRHYYVIGGFNKAITEDIRFLPTAYMKITAGAPVQFDFTARASYKDLLLAGIMFRSGDAFGLMLGVHIKPDIEFGYAYDMSYGNKTFRYNGGSHEIVLRYDIAIKEKSRGAKFSH